MVTEIDIVNFKGDVRQLLSEMFAQNRIDHENLAAEIDALRSDLRNLEDYIRYLETRIHG